VCLSVSLSLSLAASTAMLTVCLGFGVGSLGSGVWGTGFGVKSLGFRVQGPEFGDQGLVFRGVQGWVYLVPPNIWNILEHWHLFEKTHSTVRRPS